MNTIIVFLGCLAAANAGALYDGYYGSQQLVHGGLDYAGYNYGYNFAHAYTPAVHAQAPIVYQPAPVIVQHQPVINIAPPPVVQVIKPRVVQRAPPPITTAKFSVPAKRTIVVPAPAVVYQPAPVVKIAQPVLQTVVNVAHQPVFADYGYYGGYAPTYFNHKK